MGRKGLIGLACVTVGLALAYGFYAQNNAPTALKAEGALLADVNLPALNAIRYVKGEQSIRVALKDGVWVVPEKDEYPASGKAVADLVAHLKDAKKLEARTANPSLHARLGLAETGSDEEKAARLTLETDKAIELLLGNRSSQEGQLMRFAGDNQAWLVTPALNVPTEVNAWLDRRITDIAFADIKNVAVTLKDGTRFEVNRSENQPNMQVVGLASDSKVPYESAANGMATVFGGLLFEDVKKLSALPLATPEALVELTTLKEHALKAALHVVEDQHWLVITEHQGFSASELSAREGWAYRIEPRHYQALTHNLAKALKP